MADLGPPTFVQHSVFELLNHSLPLILAGLLVTVLMLWLWNARRYKAQLESLLERLTVQQDQLQKLDQLGNENQRLITRLAVADEKTNRLEELERALAEADRKYETLRDQLRQETERRARAEQQCAQIAELEQQLQAKSTKIDALQNDVTQLKTANAELQTRAQEERKNAEEKLTILQTAEAQLVTQFENLANRILDEKTQRFTEQNKNNLANVLNPLREQLSDFRKKVDDVYVSDSRDRASLLKEMQHLREQTHKINQEAVNLTRALKGDKKLQGNWGEMILERVLEQSGLRKGIEYETQGGFRDIDNRLLKPDVIVRLPEEKDIVVDSKVSLVAYERYSSAEEETERANAITEHVHAVRTHIKNLSSKDYTSLKGLRSLDFVLLFMPIEAAFMAAFQHDETLFADAFERKIIVVTPTTLLATLRTIENIWRYERQNENARAIARKAGEIYDKLRVFVEDLEKLGKQLQTAHSTYDGIMHKLTRGNRNLIRQAHSFVELGVKVKKPLPKTILEQADAELREELPNLEIVKGDPGASRRSS